MNYSVVNEISLTTRQQMQCTEWTIQEKRTCAKLQTVSSPGTWICSPDLSLGPELTQHSTLSHDPTILAIKTIKRKELSLKTYQAGIAKVTELKWNIDNIDHRLSSFQELDMSQQTQLRLYINHTYRKMWIISFAARVLGVQFHFIRVPYLWSENTSHIPPHKTDHLTELFSNNFKFFQLQHTFMWKLTQKISHCSIQVYVVKFAV